MPIIQIKHERKIQRKYVENKLLKCQCTIISYLIKLIKHIKHLISPNSKLNNNAMFWLSNKFKMNENVY